LGNCSLKPDSFYFLTATFHLNPSTTISQEKFIAAASLGGLEIVQVEPAGRNVTWIGRKGVLDAPKMVAYVMGK